MATKPIASKPPAKASAAAKTPAPSANTPRKQSAAAKPAVAKPDAAPARDKPPTQANALKKKDLIDNVVQITGAKKKTARDIVEATLKVLGDALSKGHMLNLPPFGKARVSRQQDADLGKPMTVKLRRSSAVRPPKEGLADPEDNG